MIRRLLALVCVAAMSTGCEDTIVPTAPTPTPPIRLIEAVCFWEVITPDLSVWVCK